MPVFKYDVNQDAIVEQKEGTSDQEEEEPTTPSQSVAKEEKDLESEDVGSFGSCNGVTVDLWHGVEGGSPSYVQDHMNTHK